jgi:hypothetical protein
VSEYLSAGVPAGTAVFSHEGYCEVHFSINYPRQNVRCAMQFSGGRHPGKRDLRSAINLTAPNCFHAFSCCV